MATLLALVLTGTVAGCADSNGPARDPLGTQGRACQAVERDNVAAILGVHFDTSGFAHTDDTDTCVLEQVGAAYPELTLAISGTTADALIFQATLTPSGATGVPELGRVAYQLVSPPAGADSGSSLELGWLSAAPRLVTLRYTFAPGAADADVAAMNPRLVALAHDIERQVTTGPTLG